MLLHTQTKKWSEGPEMKTARNLHGCTTIPSTEKRNAQIIVVGGSFNENTVEILDISSNSWFNAGNVPLPGPIANSLAVSNSPEYKVYSIGGSPSGRAIFGLTQSNAWVHVGNLTEERRFHRSLNVDKEDIPGCA